jgi:integration host factor subunit alpha
MENTGPMAAPIKDILASGDDILGTGFGKLCSKEREANKKEGVHTADHILPAKRAVTFKCAGRLRDRINRRPIV